MKLEDREMKSCVYLETTVPSYLTSRPSRDLIIAGRQALTREWWERRRDTFQLYISQLVVDEASAGDPTAARERLKAVQDLQLLDITPEVAELASSILASGRIPRKAATDAAHIAIAAVHGMDFLVTWNCVHIANATIAKALALICREHGCECPVICTPEALMGE
ncbi:MAG: type II toxin-antitoxin system VapC family toxin [Bryobacteraceae bacterium]